MKSSDQGVEKILSSLSYFEGQHEFGKWEGGNVTGKTEDGNRIIEMPYVTYSKGVMDFITCLYDFNFIVDYRTVNNKTFELIDTADIDTLKRLLSLIVRGDRFCEGALLTHIENGNVLKILKRLQKIA